jgi:PAS domain S-box-containing protein
MIPDSKPLILILEDEAIVAMELEERLTHLGYRVAGPVASYEAALRLADQDPPDLLVADIRIAGARSGIDVAQRLRDRYGVPAVFLSAHADGGTVQEALKTEPFGYLTKPFREQELHATIETALQRHRLERELARREQQLAAAQRLGKIGHWERQLSGSDSYMSPEICQMLGIDRDAAKGDLFQAFLERVHPEDRAGLQAVVRSALEGQEATDYRYRIVRPDGTERNIHSRTEVQRDASGKATRLFGMSQDVTDLEQARRAAEESERRFSALFESSPDAVVVVNGAGQIELANGSAKTLFGYPGSEFQGMEIERLVPEARRAQHLRHRQSFEHAPRFRAMGSGLELEAVTKTGNTFPVEVSLGHMILGGRLVVMAAVRDVSDRKQAERKLKEREELYRALFDHAVDGIFVHDDQGRFLSVNPAAAAMTGYSRDELLRLSAADVVAPEDLSRMEIPWERVLAPAPYVRNRVLLCKDGTRRFVEVISTPIPGGRVQGIARDITERVRAEAALKESEARFRTLFEQAIDGIFVTDRNGNYLDANPSACKMLGYTREELLRLNIEQVWAPEEAAQALTNLGHLEPGAASVRVETVVRKDGTRLTVEVIANLRPDGLIQAITRDISDRKRAEEALQQSEQRLRQSQKMEAIGQLAGGIAHDFNNMLQIIRGYTDFAYSETAPESPVRTHLDTVLQAVENGAALTRQILTFSRGNLVQKQSVDLVSLAEEQAHLMRRLLGEHIELKVSSKVPRLMVHADPGMLHQVFLNLCVNARDAMPNGGEILLELDSVPADATFCAAHPELSPGVYAQVAVSDTGSGMTEEIRDHLFEPFFTTKEQGKGTGLGLSTVYGIVRNHGGVISVYSEPGLGTTFRLFFPRTETAPAAKEPQADYAQGGTETVLVAEDDEIVRKLVVKLLETKGYKVIQARDGREAVELFAKMPQSIGLLLLDMVMPKQGGVATFRQIKAMAPRVPVVMTTGFAGNMADSAFIEANHLPIVRKPHLPGELFRAVREALDAAKP